MWCFWSAIGMKDALISTFSWIVRAFIACCVTIQCRALVGSECLVVGGVGFSLPFLVEMRLVGISRGASTLGIGCTLLIVGNFPGVLFWVTLAWILGVDFSARLEVGLRACIIGGASVICGTVMIDVLSITICSSTLTLCSSSLTLCCACGVAIDAWGVRMFLIFTCNFLMSARPLAVVPALVVMLVSSLVSACKCWCCVRFGTWQCWKNISVDPNILYALVSGTKYRLHR